MGLKDEFLNIAASVIINGYEQASIDASIQILSLVVCRVEDIPLDKRDSFEKDIKWLVETKIKELKR